MNETFLLEMNPQFAADYCSKAREALSSISTDISNCATYSVPICSVTTSVTTHLNCFRLLVTHGFHTFFTRLRVTLPRWANTLHKTPVGTCARRSPVRRGLMVEGQLLNKG